MHVPEPDQNLDRPAYLTAMTRLANIYAWVRVYYAVDFDKLIIVGNYVVKGEYSERLGAKGMLSLGTAPRKKGVKVCPTLWFSIFSSMPKHALGAGRRI